MAASALGSNRPRPSSVHLVFASPPRPPEESRTRKSRRTMGGPHSRQTGCGPRSWRNPAASPSGSTPSVKLTTFSPARGVAQARRRRGRVFHVFAQTSLMAQPFPVRPSDSSWPTRVLRSGQLGHLGRLGRQGRSCIRGSNASCRDRWSSRAREDDGPSLSGAEMIVCAGFATSCRRGCAWNQRCGAKRLNSDTRPVADQNSTPRGRRPR